MCINNFVCKNVENNKNILQKNQWVSFDAHKVYIEAVWP